MAVGKRTEILPPTVWGKLGVERDPNRPPYSRKQRRAMHNGTYDWSPHAKKAAPSK